MHARKGKNPDLDLPEGTYYGKNQLDLREYALSDEVFDAQVSLNLHLSSECLP